MTDTITIKRQFFNALKRGTGEAYLIAKANPDIDFSNYIIKGSLKNYSYDNQSEGSRAYYIFELIKLSKQKDKIRLAVLKELATEKKDSWTLVQLFDIAALFAKQGDKEAKKGIYRRFYRKIIDNDDWAGSRAIIDVDGFEGLKHIATTIGKALEKNPDDKQNGFIIRHFQDTHKSIDTFKALEKEAKSNRYIRIYLENIKSTELNWKKQSNTVLNFKDTLEGIRSGIHRPMYYYYRKKFNAKEIKIIANTFLAEKDNYKKGRILSVFNKYKYPFDYNLILELAKKKPNKTDRLTEYAIDALKYIQAKDIRQFALDKLNTSNQPTIFTDLLISNYKKGDSNILKSKIKRYNNEHIIENLADSSVKIYEKNKTKECKEPLLALYRKMNCGIHRNSVVKILIENNVLPDSINDEIAFDSYIKTRKLHRKRK